MEKKLFPLHSAEEQPVVEEETCDNCGNVLGDDAPLYEDADICRTCHEEIRAAEAVRG